MRTLLTTSILLLATAGTAHAAQLSVQEGSGGKTLVYAAAPGEINQVSVDLQGSHYTVQDLAGSPMTVQAPCTTWTDPMLQGTAAKCPAQDVSGIELLLGDQTDSADVGGITNVLVPVTIAGGPGPDHVFSGNGSDTIYVLNGTADDNVTCNGGDDTVYADPTDTVAADCEHILLQPAAQNPPPPPFQARVRVGRSTVRYGCSAGCSVTGTLMLHSREVGSTHPIELLNGGAARVRFKLSRAGKRALAARGRLRMRLTATFTTSSGVVTQLSRPVLLRR